MMATVPRSDMGMARMTLSVLESDPRNSQQTRAVRMTDRKSSNWISLTDSRMNSVLSKVMATVMSSGSVLRYSSMARADFLGHGHGVGAALLLDADALGRDAVDPGDAPDVLETVLDQGDVAEVDRTAVDLADDDLPQGLEVDRLAEDADVDLAAGGFEPPGRQLDVLALEGGDDVADGQALLVEPGGVEPDADVPLQGAHEGDLADAGDRLELLLEAVADVIAEDPLGVGPAQAGHHDRLVLGIGLGDDGRVHVPGKAAGGLGDLGLDVLEGQVDVAGKLDLDGDVAGALAGGRGDRPDALDLDQGLLERLDDLVLHDLRGRPFPDGRDVDRGEIDVRELADADPRRRPRGRRRSSRP